DLQPFRAALPPPAQVRALLRPDQIKRRLNAIRSKCAKQTNFAQKHLSRFLQKRPYSATNAEFLDQHLVAPLVAALEVVEQLTTLRHELEKPAPRMIVLYVGLEMLGEIVDPL